MGNAKVNPEKLQVSPEEDTLDYIREYYTIVNGIIRTPGSFEGEPEWTPLVHEMYLNGFVDGNTEDGCYVEIDDMLRTKWELSDDTVAVVLHFSEYGFIQGIQYNQSGFNWLLDDPTANTDDDEDDEDDTGTQRHTISDGCVDNAARGKINAAKLQEHMSAVHYKGDGCPGGFVAGREACAQAVEHGQAMAQKGEIA